MKKRCRWHKVLVYTVICLVLTWSMVLSGAQNGFGAAAAAENAVEKNEIVYVKTDAAGKPAEQTVEVILKNMKEGIPVEDISSLQEIENVEDTGEFTEVTEGRYLWKNYGKEIHYKGMSEEPIPVNVHITYYLEGKEVTAQKIAGKTGKIKLRLDYENSTRVPFFAFSSVSLSPDVFSEVKVTNGRVLDLGGQKVVIGYAFPGIAECMRPAEQKIRGKTDLPEYIEIEAKAKVFELDPIETVVSTGLFDRIKENPVGNIENVSYYLQELINGSLTYKETSKNLADRGSAFKDSLTEYFEGLSGIRDGIAQFDKTLSEIDLPADSSEETGKTDDSVQKALDALEENSSLLKEKLEGIGTLLDTFRTFEENVRTYGGQVKSLQKTIEENPVQDLSGKTEEWSNMLEAEAVSQIKGTAQAAAQQAVSSAAEAAAAEAAAATVEDARESVALVLQNSSVFDDLGLMPEQISAVQEQLIAEIQEVILENTGDGQMITVDIGEPEVDLDAAFSGIVAEIQTNADNSYSAIQDASNMITELEIPDSDAFSSTNMEEITQILEKMDQSLTEIDAYVEKTASIAADLESLSEICRTLKDGVSNLSKKSEELSPAYEKLTDDLKKASENAAGFDEGIVLNLAVLIRQEYLDVIQGIRAAQKADKSYTNYSGICDGQKGSVKFIIRTEEIPSDIKTTKQQL